MTHVPSSTRLNRAYAPRWAVNGDSLRVIHAVEDAALWDDPCDPLDGLVAERPSPRFLREARYDG